MCDILNVLEKLNNAVSFQFKKDGTCPNVTISKLRNGNFYGSVVRYPSKDKKVVCKAVSPTLEELIPNLAKAFLNGAKSTPDPLQELSSALVAPSDNSNDVVGGLNFQTGFDVSGLFSDVGTHKIF